MRNIKKGLLGIEISQYNGPYAFLSIHTLSNSKILETIDLWVMKDKPTGQITGLKVAVFFKSNFDQKRLNKEMKQILEEMNHTHLYFNEPGKEKVTQKAQDFLVSLCKLEGLEPGFFDFILNISILNKNEIHQDPVKETSSTPSKKLKL